MADQIHSVTKLVLLETAGATSECYGAYSARLARIVQAAGHVVRSCVPYSKPAAAHGAQSSCSACLKPASRQLLVSRHSSSRDLMTWMPEAAASVTRLSTSRQQLHQEVLRQPGIQVQQVLKHSLNQ